MGSSTAGSPGARGVCNRQRSTEHRCNQLLAAQHVTAISYPSPTYYFKIKLLGEELDSVPGVCPLGRMIVLAQGQALPGAQISSAPMAG